MIDEVFKLLSDKLDTFLKDQSSSDLEIKVEFMNEEPFDSLKFSTNTICPVLIRIEEEKTLRPADRYVRSTAKGTDKATHISAPPAIPIHLYIMFVASYKIYLEGLKNLSRVILFFQANPIISAKLISDDMPDLIVELQTLKSNEWNEIWGMLRAPLQPSVMYKVTLFMMESESAKESNQKTLLEKDIEHIIGGKALIKELMEESEQKLKEEEEIMNQ